MRRSELKRKTPLKVKNSLGKAGSSTATHRAIDATREKMQGEGRPVPKARSKGFSTTSPAQRKKARDEPCIVTATTKEFNVVDPAHLWAAARGGCKDPLCVVPLVREVHQRFDNGDFDLLPYLVRRRVPELCHALEHAEGDLIGLLQRLTGERWSPDRTEG